MCVGARLLSYYMEEELYLEVKKVWKSIYPAYIDLEKTVAEGITHLTQVAGLISKLQ